MSSKDFPSMLERVPEPIFIPLYSSGKTMAECGCSGASTPNGIHIYPCITHSGINALPVPVYLHLAVMHDADDKLADNINADLEKLPGSRVYSVTEITTVPALQPITRVLVIYEALSMPVEPEGKEDDQPTP